MKFSKNFNNKKCAPKIIFFNEFFFLERFGYFLTLKVRILPFLTTFAQLSARLKTFLGSWLLVLGIKKGLVKCATVCVKSVVILPLMCAQSLALWVDLILKGLFWWHNSKVEKILNSDLEYFDFFGFTKLVSVKVEKILKGSLDSIPSPSVKVQIMSGKGVKAKHCWMLSTNFWIQKIC